MYGRDAYRQSAAQTASPAQLVLMLYDGALLRIERAQAALSAEPRDLAATHELIVRTQMIVDELRLSLDHDRGGAIAGQLASVYTYVGELLLDANIRKDAVPLEEAATLLRPLRDTWEQACVNAPDPVAVAG